jgi:hypothetical protein
LPFSGERQHGKIFVGVGGRGQRDNRTDRKRGAHPGQRKQRRTKSYAAILDDKIFHRSPQGYEAKAGVEIGQTVSFASAE